MLYYSVGLHKERKQDQVLKHSQNVHMYVYYSYNISLIFSTYLIGLSTSQ